MDPDVSYKTMKEALKILRAEEENRPSQVFDDALEDLLDSVEALDGWLSKGGFPPKAWARTQPCPKCGWGYPSDKPRYTEPGKYPDSDIIRAARIGSGDRDP